MAKSSKDIADALGAMTNDDVEGDAGELHADMNTGAAPPPKLPRAATGAVTQTGREANKAPAAPAKPAPPSASIGAAPAAAAGRATARPPSPSIPPSPKPMGRRPTPVPNPHSAPAPASSSPAISRPSRPAAPLPAAKAAAPAKPKPAVPPSQNAAAKTGQAVTPATVEYAKPETRKKKVKVPYYATLDFRQTVIPPLLVVGAGLIVMCVLYFCQPSDAALRSAGVLPPLLLALFGAALLGLAGLNMTRVKAQLAEAARLKAENKSIASSRTGRSR